MKRVLTSAGVLALGAASLCALDPEMTRQASGSPFTFSGTVRGFYDDNINTAPDRSRAKEDSFGFQVVPAVHINLPFEQTFLSLGYIYTLSWYDKRDPDIDQAHEISAKFRHQFSPRHQISVDDSFVFTSEPTVADRSGGIITTPLRSKGSVYHNYGNVGYNAGLTRTLSLSLGYGNHWYDYTSDGDFSRSALLDRMEHLIRADLQHQFNPKLVGIVGYSFGFTSFEGNDLIFGGQADDPATTVDESLPPLKSDSRDSRSHYGYIGADYDITAKLRTSARIGAQFSEYPDLDESSANPYVNISLSYRIRSSTSLEAGVKHARNATDVAAVDNQGRPTLDAETTSLYAQLTHQITRQLSGSLIGQYQHSTFNEGINDDESEYLWLFGANLNYSFSRHWSAEVGYNYDQLVSDVSSGGRSYDRNRVYIGVTARY